MSNHQERDILFVVPHQPVTASMLSKPSGITPPHGIGYIASYLESKDFAVDILDNSIERLSLADFGERVKAASPAFVAFSVCTSSYNPAVALAQTVKQVDPQIVTMMGGVHPSALPEEVIKNDCVDIVIVGEGEVTTLEILEAYQGPGNLKDVNGILFKAHGQTVRTAKRELYKNIDELPFPAYHLMPMSEYSLPISRRLTNKNVGSVITSRGCPYKCKFCSHNCVFERRVRFRSPESVVAEMEYLERTFNIGEIVIWDDSFLMHKKRVLDICRLIKEKGLRLTWSCSSRVDHITEEILAELYSAGCRLILFGAESGCQSILDSIAKGTQTEQIRKAVALCKEQKIISFCSFILGTPGETHESIKTTIQFAIDLDPDYAIFCIFAPLPGSDFFDEFYAKGLLDLDNIDWDSYINLLSCALPLVAASDITKEELIQYQKTAFRRFYFRPGYLLKRMFNLYSWNQVFSGLRGVRALVQLMFHKFMPAKEP